MRRLFQILIGLALGALTISFAANLIENYFQTTNWGFTVFPPFAVLVLVYGGIIFGALVGIVGLLSPWSLVSRILLLVGCITLTIEASFFLTDGLFIFIVPPAIYF